MADVTNELIYEVLKVIQRDIALVRDASVQTRQELVAVRGHLNAVQQDVHNIYEALAKHGDCLDRIERRLKLVDAH